MILTSPAFLPHGAIPTQYTGEGTNLSPTLHWAEVPTGCRELLLICEDSDAPHRTNRNEPFVHWLVYGISPALHGLPGGLPPDESLTPPVSAYQGRNSFEQIGYGGPLPPVGDRAHHYVFQLFALDQPLRLPAGIARSALQHALRETRILDSAQLIGTYQRAAARSA